MKSRDVVFSICDYAKDFVRKYKNPNLDQKVIDAIVVDFINYFAAMQCGIDLAMYTCDLRRKKKMCEEGIPLEKKFIIPTLEFHKTVYDRNGIAKSINMNEHMNECNGEAEFDNSEAVKLIEEFINGYKRVTR